MEARTITTPTASPRQHGAQRGCRSMQCTFFAVSLRRPDAITDLARPNSAKRGKVLPLIPCMAMNEILPPGQVQKFHTENASWKQVFVLLRRRLMSVRPQETVTLQLTVPSTSPIFLESPSRHIASKYRIIHCQARALKTSKSLKAGFSHPSHQTPQSTQGVWG